MTKKQKLDKLDGLLLDKLIDIMDSDTEDGLESLSNLSVPMNYLKNNAVVSEKGKSTIEEDTKKRLAEAKKRRASKDSK